ncbi:MAG: mechanosensitive ion channel family protein [Candidatus Omnitrophota bacterium]
MLNVQKAIQLLGEKIQGWFEGFVLILPNLIIALLIMVGVNYVASSLQDLVKKLLQRVIKNHALVNFLGILTRVTVFLFGLLVSIKILKLDEALFSVLAGVGIAGLAIGFAFQDVASNFIAGIALVFRADRPFKVGDIVKTNDYMGVIEEINLRDSLIRTFSGQAVFIPNKSIFENAVINYSLMGRRRVDLEVGISYGDDLEKVKTVVLSALKEITPLSPLEEIEIFFKEFGNSSINFDVRFWVPFIKQTDFLKARDQAVMKIKRAFDENDITIPFPIRTLDFGIKGGEKLSAMLSEKSHDQKNSF